MLLNIETRHVDPNVDIVQIAGKLALGRESQRLEGLVDDLLKKGASNVIFDMKGVEYIDSSGVGMIAFCSGKLKESSGKMAIAGAQGRVLQVLEMTQISSIVPMYETLEAALAAVTPLTQPPASA